MGNTSLQQPFDATQVAPQAVREAVPTAWYDAVLFSGGWEPTSKTKADPNNGEYMMVLNGKIIEGKYKDIEFTDRLNLMNHTPLAVEIAQRTMSAICHATGVMQVQDVSVLFNRPLMVRLEYKPAVMNADGSQKYGAGNDVKGYAAVGTKDKTPLPFPVAAAAPGAIPAPGAGGATFSPPAGWGAAPAPTPHAPPPPPSAPAAAPTWAPPPAPAAPAPAAAPTWAPPPAPAAPPAPFVPPAGAPGAPAAPIAPPWAPRQ